MSVTLDQIVAATRIRVAERQRVADMHRLEQQAVAHQPRGFRAAVARKAADGPAIIAELKQASPSKGTIRASFDVAALAREYATAGAAALSVLTEEEFFRGSLDHLRTASAVTSLPCLRKDFIVNRFQLLEARAHGADAILLLASVLDEVGLTQLSESARELQLDVLCEVHDEAELQQALAAGCNLIGVNNRDLRTFKVDLQTALRLGPQVPAGIIKVAESGIQSATDLQCLRAAGFNVFLIGELFMRAQHPGEALAQLLSQCGHQAISQGSKLPS